ncbi:MAG: OPT family oligopeptide transporter [Planctomycetaceae bacterium]
MDADRLPVDFGAVPVADRDRVWVEGVYRGDDAPQATLRAILMGGAIGGVMSLSNLYIGLKTGWGLGVGITACIVSYAVWQAFMRLGIARTEMTILENNCMQSTATSAGVSTGGTMVSAIAAYLIITREHIAWPVLTAWTACLALLGVAIAVPMKRQMINREQLAFPSGVAAAETLRSLYAGGGTALLKARSLFVAMGCGLVVKWLVEGNALLAGMGSRATGAAWRIAAAWLGTLSIPAKMPWSWNLLGGPASRFGLATPVDPIMMAAGAIVGLRTAASMALGAFVLFGLLAPWLELQGVFAEMHALGAIKTAAVSPDNVRKWGLWTGSAMMVAAGLTAFAFQWRSLVHALAGLGALFGRRRDTAHDPVAHIEVPASWFLAGTLVAGAGCIAIMHFQWNVPLHLGVVAVLLAFVLSLVACRAAGETDITPIGAMGKVTQLFYGYAMPQRMDANLMTAGVTAGAAGAAADLLTDLKSGYLLGANARRQTLAQAAGILFGTIVIVPAWYVLVPDAAVISGPTAKFTAPAASVWASVAELLSEGFDSLHATCQLGMVIGAVLGVAITVIEQLAPRWLVRWIPSATGLGLAFVIDFHDSIAFLVGAGVAALLVRLRPTTAETYVVPVSSGIIAGESLMGVAIAFLTAFGVLREH